jgi:NitT/TauT family transport system substrate-binding protein
MFRRLILLPILCLLPFAVVAQSVEDIPFFMTFVPNIQFAQMYVGIEKGYFEDAGYRLILEYGNEPDGVELIALGERDYGLIAGEQVILARSNDRPVVSVYEWWQQYPIAIVTSADSGITSPTDLAGRTVGVPGRFGATYSGLVAFLNANNLTEDDINLQEIGFNAPEVVCLGGVEASAVYGNNEPLQIAQRAAANDCDAVTEVRIFSVSDFADLVSNGLVTNEALIAEEPERVAAMVAAFDRSVQDVINNPAEAYLLSESHIDNLPMTPALREVLTAIAEEQNELLATNPDQDTIAGNRDALYQLVTYAVPAEDLLQFQVLIETVKLWEAEQTGLAELSSWELTQDTLLGMGFIDTPIDLQAAFTNDFLP